MRSICCHAKVRVEGSATQHHVCLRCGKPCDVEPIPNPFVCEGGCAGCQIPRDEMPCADLKCDLSFALEQHKQLTDEANAQYHRRMRAIALKYFPIGTKVRFTSVIARQELTGVVTAHMPETRSKQNVVVVRQTGAHNDLSRWVPIERLKLI